MGGVHCGIFYNANTILAGRLTREVRRKRNDAVLSHGPCVEAEASHLPQHLSDVSVMIAHDLQRRLRNGLALGAAHARLRLLLQLKLQPLPNTPRMLLAGPQRIQMRSSTPC